MDFVIPWWHSSCWLHGISHFNKISLTKSTWTRST